ncbi:hypothetical protein C0Q70_06900 [Pomacea canaliculata]|uniref:Uncharacterized protein n=2 Tax=Pomacea canaliculata TaxID=400727 RepID=A0A2T7PDJ6_POMCA|nr:hypothetical protein C0Q70_06900 [Pomacea canaliculata]
MSELLASLEGKELKDMRSLASTHCQDAQGLHDRSGVETSLPQVIYLVPLLVFNTAQQNMNGKISNFKRELETEEPIYEAQQQKECAKITIIKREALSDKREEFHEHHQTLNADVKKREVQNQEEQITKFEQQIDYVKNIKKELKIEQEEQLLNTFKYADFVSTINMKMECPIDND